MSSFLTLSSLVTPSILYKHIISQACNLLTCLFCTVQVSQPYKRVGTTIALNTHNFVSFFSSLRSITSFLIVPTTLITAPIRCSNHLLPHYTNYPHRSPYPLFKLLPASLHQLPSSQPLSVVQYPHHLTHH